MTLECVAYHCVYMRYYQQKNKGFPSRLNEVLTPVACQTLLTYTFILGESPIRLHPSFVLRCLLRWFSHAGTQISAHLEHYISAHLEHYIGIIIGYVTGIYVQ